MAVKVQEARFRPETKPYIDGKYHSVLFGKDYEMEYQDTLLKVTAKNTKTFALIPMSSMVSMVMGPTEVKK